MIEIGTRIKFSKSQLVYVVTKYKPKTDSYEAIAEKYLNGTGKNLSSYKYPTFFKEHHVLEIL